MKILKDKKKIIAWLKKYKVENYTLVEDVDYGIIVDVDGDVNLFNKQLTQLPVKFSKVSGYFDCVANQLTNLEGGPTSVSGDFYCSDNTALGEYKEINDFKIIKEKILSDKEKKLLSTSLDKSNLTLSVLKL